MHIFTIYSKRDIAKGEENCVKSAVPTELVYLVSQVPSSIPLIPSSDCETFCEMLEPPKGTSGILMI